MDTVDAAILREMLRDRALLWGGGDPRLDMTAFAKRLGIDRTTVWARLKAWKAQGFLVRQEIVPNPALFDAGVAVGDIRVDPRRKRDVIHALSLAEGILGGSEQVGEYILLLYAHPSPTALDRCTRLLGALPGVVEVSTCIPFEPPQSVINPTLADWRILAALRRAPDAPFAAVAKEAGISTRTLTRRYADLLAANAMWWFPVFDFTRYRDAVLTRFLVTVANKKAAASLVRAAHAPMPHIIWSHVNGGDEGKPAWVEIHAHLDSAAAVEDVEGALMSLPNVQAVESFFPKSWFVLPTWFDERIAERLKA